MSGFRGQQLKVAVEAATGWRFVAEELRHIGAVMHLAEPAETAAKRGHKKRAKTDRAVARGVRVKRRGGPQPRDAPNRPKITGKSVPELRDLGLLVDGGEDHVATGATESAPPVAS